MTPRLFASLLPTLASILCLSSTIQAAELWSQWRGGDQRGVADGERFPLRWSEEQGVAWKLQIPGRGGSTPVVRDGIAYLTTGHEGENRLLAIDVESGEVRWQTSLGEDRGPKHKKGSGSNPSPVVDDQRVFVYFRSGDVACVDLSGNKTWHLNLQDLYGSDELWWDLGNSPLLTDTALILVSMQTPPAPSYVLALDKRTGDVVWKTDRNVQAPQEAAQSYTTPLSVDVDGTAAIAVMGADHLTLHSEASGEWLGQLGGFNPSQNGFFRSIASPVASGQRIVCPYSRGETLTCVDLSRLASGAERDAILWHRDDLGSDVPTPAIHGNLVLLINDGKSARGTVHALDLASGELAWEVQLPRSRLGFSSSPLVAGNHLYVTREDATTFVVGPLDAASPELVSENPLADTEEYTVASPVPANDSLLIRTRNFLYRVSE